MNPSDAGTRRSSWARFLSAVPVLLWLAGCVTYVPNPRDTTPAGRGPATSSKPAATKYLLGRGDKIHIDVFGEPELSLDATLDASGSINYPLLGSLHVAGLTPAQLERLLDRRLAGGYLKNPDVTVSVVQYRPIYVIGAVRNAGAFPFSPGLTVEKALALAGGLTPQASTRRIYLLGEGADASQRRQVKLDTAIKPGETILVEEGIF